MKIIMQNQSIESLRQHIKTHKDDLLNDAKRVEGIIRDTFPEHKSLANIMVTAWKEGVVKELKQTSNPEVTIAQFSDRLSQEYGLKESSALTAVRVWAYALCIINDIPDVNISSTSAVNAQSNITSPPYTNTNIGGTSSTIGIQSNKSKIQSNTPSLKNKSVKTGNKLSSPVVAKLIFVVSVIYDFLFSLLISDWVSSSFKFFLIKWFIFLVVFIFLVSLLVIVSCRIYYSSKPTDKKSKILLIKSIIQLIFIFITPW